MQVLGDRDMHPTRGGRGITSWWAGPLCGLRLGNIRNYKRRTREGTLREAYCPVCDKVHLFTTVPLVSWDFTIPPSG